MRWRALLALATTGWLVPAAGWAAVLCVAPGGAGGCSATIQGAVDAALSGDTIDVAAGTYGESVFLAAGSRLTIQGAGPGLTIVDPAGTHAGFDVHGPGTNVALRGVTIQNSAGLYSGVMMSERAKMTLTRVDITGNPGHGVMAFNNSRLTITESTIRENAHGLLIYPRSRLVLARSTVSANRFIGVYGFEHNAPGGTPAPFLLIEDSTISGNGTDEHPFLAGGVQGGSSRIFRSTITENFGLGVDGPGRGMQPRVGSTILSNNGSDCTETIHSRGYNFVGTACAANLTGPAAASDLVGDDPMLGPLQDNGGPTPTQAPTAGSAVLEAVNRPCREPDQRGVTRLPTPCDVGAVEAP